MCVMCILFVMVTIAPRFIPAEEVIYSFYRDHYWAFLVWMVIKEQPSIETIQGGLIII